MENLKYLLLLTLLSGIVSCNLSTNPIISVNNDVIYPLKIGNSWTYNSNINYTNISPDSIKDRLVNSSYNYNITVEEKTILNSKEVYKLLEPGTGAFGYYANEESGFKEYAYNSVPTNVLPKTNNTLKFLFNGKYYTSILDLIKEQEESYHQTKPLLDTLVFYNPPKTIYKYPFEIGQEWILNTDPEIKKEVIGKAIVQLNKQNYECYQIKWKYDFNSDGKVDDNIEYNEYVNSKGLLKSEILIKGLIISSEESPEGIGTSDVRYERNVTDINF